MMSLKSLTLSGFLLEWPGGPVQREDLGRATNLVFVRQVPQSRWEEYEFTWPQPLRGEDPHSQLEPFRYIIIARRSGSRLLLLSVNRHIVEILLDRDLSKSLIPNVRKVAIGVNDLVKALSTRPTLYTLSFVHARVPAFGASLRSASFYGDDLGEASLFRDNLHLMTFFTCGLRPVNGSHEIVRLGGDGAISFIFLDNRLLEVEKVLRFLRTEGYLAVEVLSD